jgi:hypothetical protein
MYITRLYVYIYTQWATIHCSPAKDSVRLGHAFLSRKHEMTLLQQGTVGEHKYHKFTSFIPYLMIYENFGIFVHISKFLRVSAFSPSSESLHQNFFKTYSNK